MTRRRGDTRERIQQVALEMFAERGYEKATLREIAERLGVTKAALYYHFASKEEILGSLIEDVSSSMDEIVRWTQSQPPSPQTRQEALRRLFALARGRWQPLVRFLQENRSALRGLDIVGEQVRERRQALFSLFDDDICGLSGKLRARLAVFAILMGAMHEAAEFDATQEQMDKGVLEVAFALIEQAISDGS